MSQRTISIRNIKPQYLLIYWKKFARKSTTIAYLCKFRLNLFHWNFHEDQSKKKNSEQNQYYWHRSKFNAPIFSSNADTEMCIHILKSISMLYSIGMLHRGMCLPENFLFFFIYFFQRNRSGWRAGTVTAANDDCACLLWFTQWTISEEEVASY